MKKGRTGRRSGIKMGVCNVMMIVLAGLVAAALLYTAYATWNAHVALQHAIDRYTACKDSADDMQAASDYLTQQAQGFAVTGKQTFLDNYFEETGVTRRREHALAVVGEFFGGTQTYRALEDALNRSNDLMEREYRSMRLVIAANGEGTSGYPEPLAAVALTPEEEALPAQEKAELARSLVFDETYEGYKADISRDVEMCLDAVISQLEDEQAARSRQMGILLRAQFALTGLLMMIAAAIVIVTDALLVRPVVKSPRYIQSGELLPETGAWEMRYVAHTYNRLAEQTQAHQERLSYEASHDPLTALYNRGAFEQARQAREPGSVAMILVDLDRFKQINDQFGHEVGDMALKKLAALLKGAFRSEDLVCRIGGDEFAVIMLHADPSIKELIARKIEHVSREAQQASDGAPAFTLSVGVAFGDRSVQEDAEDIFNRADAALYRIKNSGRNGLAFDDSTPKGDGNADA